MTAPTPEQRAEWRREARFAEDLWSDRPLSDDDNPITWTARLRVTLDALDAAEAKVALLTQGNRRLSDPLPDA
jgi:hypothetical protein